MPVLFSDLFKDSAFEVNNRRDLKALYDEVKAAVKTGDLALEGHTLPASFNDWIRSVEGDKKLPKRDVDVVDFSLAKNKAYDTWRQTYLASKNPVVMSPGAKTVLEAVQDLGSANANSMGLMNGTKDDVVAALSDLQAAVALFLTAYDRTAPGLNLPERTTPLERVKVAKLPAKRRTTKVDRAPKDTTPKATNVKRSQRRSLPKEASAG